jgi:CRISPR-associated protein Csb2
MPFHLCLTVRFLDAAFHGRGDGDEPEWPPSPLRVFQALVAAAARKNAGKVGGKARSAFEWLEGQTESPIVIAPSTVEGSGYRLSVPNNAMDIVARAWSRGNDSNSGDANPATHRTMKSVRPTLLASDATHYVWQLQDEVSDEIRDHMQLLSEAAANVVALGWGLDLVVGHGALLSDADVEQLAGEQWLPCEGTGGRGLRIPVRGTLEDVLKHHQQFLKRLGEDGFVPPPPLSKYKSIEYRRAIDPPTRPFAAFALLRLDASGFRAFDTVRRGLTVAGMMRSTVKTAAARSGWTETRIASFVLGHGESNVGGGHTAVGPRRFAYYPLPSIESRNERGDSTAGSIRRVIVSTLAGECKEEIAWAQRAVSGQELRNENTKQPVALLSLIPSNEKVVRCYTRSAAVWATVTPMVLPGYDDPKHYRRRMEQEIGAEEQRELLGRLDARIDGLLRKAIAQAGFSEALASNAELDWRKVGFWRGSELADRYGVPDHLKQFPRYHVKIRWRGPKFDAVKIQGPICLGGGRFYGLGLFAAV